MIRKGHQHSENVVLLAILTQAELQASALCSHFTLNSGGFASAWQKRAKSMVSTPIAWREFGGPRCLGRSQMTTNHKTGPIALLTLQKTMQKLRAAQLALANLP